MKIRNVLAIVLFVHAGILGVNAQLNIKIGYSLVLSGFDEVNLIHQEYNAQNGEFLEQILPDVGAMHGIEIGVRYKFSGLAVELSLTNVSTTRQGFGLDANDTFFSNELDYSLNNYSLGIENYFGKFGYGATVDLRRLGITSEIPNVAEVRRTLTNQTSSSSTFYLAYVIHQGPRVSFVLKPYYQLGWGSYDIDELRPELIEGAIEQPQSFTPNVFGISILFYNGR